MYGPIFICCCCHRTLFIASVVAFTDKVIEDINRKASSILGTCIYEDEAYKKTNKATKHFKTKRATQAKQDVEDRLKVDIGKGKQAWLCKTCKSYLQKDRMPPMCSKNLLTIKEALNIPLTEMEANLIAPSILFMKIWFFSCLQGSLPQRQGHKRSDRT